mgnify:CR=1 FL=1
MKTLKLDSSYRPIEIIDAFDAFCMIYMGRANLVEVYDNKFIRSAYQAYPVPCVISLNRYVKVGKITLKCNKRNVCNKCNQKKGNRLPHEVGMIPLRLPAPPPPHVFQTVGIKETHHKWFAYLRGKRLGYY